jgi:hypothetical protein
MPLETNPSLLLGVIVLLLVWLVYRIRRSVKKMIQNEIFKNFPDIKDAIENFNHRLEYLKIEIELLEKRMKEIKSRTD